MTYRSLPEDPSRVSWLCSVPGDASNFKSVAANALGDALPIYRVSYPVLLFNREAQ
jgi:hypothetical protein